MHLSPQKLPLKIHCGIFATVAFSSTALFAGLLLSTGASPAHAEETEIDVNVPASIALTASPTTVNIGTLAPESFGSAYTDLTVSTNSAGGYSLKIASATSSTSLVHSNGSATGHLDSITAPVTINTTGSNFPGDKWGYSIGQSASSTSKDYQTIPASTSATEIAHKETPVMDDVTRVNFGTRPTSSSASGTYSGTVTFTATAKDVVKDITLLTSMQDLATHPEYCTNSAVGTIKTNLPDLTNTTSAGATKMAHLTYNSTNPATAGRIKVASSGNKTANGNSNAFSYDSGNYTDDNYTEPYIMIYRANKSATYDGQTPYGALYNYCAATGGTVCNRTTMSTDSQGSICPKGWKLPGMTATPTGTGADTSGTTKSYNNLANSYGYGNTQAGMQGMLGIDNPKSSPINLVRAGYAGNGSLNNRSTSGSGNYWSSTKYPSTDAAYRLRLYNYSDLYVDQSGYARYNGLSVRCVSL